MKWMPPEKLYEEIDKTGGCVIGIDFGGTTTGLCVGKVCDGKVCNMKVCNWRYAYPMMALGNLGPKDDLSALESYFNSFSDGYGEILDGKWFLPDDLYSPQVVNSKIMTVSVAREILNTLAVNYGAQYYVFGFNADEGHWDVESNYAFLKNQIIQLEQDGNLAHKCFTIVDESHSTNCADKFLKTQFPELSDAGKILEMYPEIPHELRWQYNKSGEFDLDRFEDDLAQFRKRLLDCYSAAHFTRIFLDKGYRGLLPEGDDRAKAKDERMMKFAHDLGYDVSRGASLQRQGKFREAIKYHSMVLAISERKGQDSGNTEAYGAIADCYTELGDLEGAGKFYY
ncbi:hypothetical protein LWI28_014930 [Acer negundo]|uniref:Uncharacterized protein n=1 Tax=Acer negundo TaxID=4023 RepID=A0AAD5IEY3_ACENE|nr:hypothetical protein LWI28_014930 [Acer negundo]